MLDENFCIQNSTPSIYGIFTCNECLIFVANHVGKYTKLVLVRWDGTSCENQRHTGASQDDSDPPLPPIGDLADESAPVMTEVPLAQIAVCVTGGVGEITR